VTNILSEFHKTIFLNKLKIVENTIKKNKKIKRLWLRLWGPPRVLLGSPDLGPMYQLSELLSHRAW
jgi:hypothetical protein